VQGSESRVQGSESMVQGSGSRVQGSGYRVQGSKSRVWDTAFFIQGLQFCDWGSGFLGFWSLGSRVLGSRV
jgi:energy-converting hydrogenase Eha subunit G